MLHNARHTSIFIYDKNDLKIKSREFYNFSFISMASLFFSQKKKKKKMHWNNVRRKVSFSIEDSLQLDYTEAHFSKKSYPK